jgi:hypothetical protein
MFRFFCYDAKGNVKKNAVVDGVRFQSKLYIYIYLAKVTQFSYDGSIML